MNSIKKVLAGSLAVVTLSGCGNLSPIWPMSGDFAPYPNYPTAGTCDPSQVSANSLACAQKDAVDTAQSYADARQRLEMYHNGDVLALVGLGTVAGVNIVSKGSKIQLQNLGLAAAALVGLNSALGIDGQHQIYGAGLDAVECLIKVDAELDKAAPAISMSLADAPLSPQALQSGKVTMAEKFLSLPHMADLSAAATAASLVSTIEGIKALQDSAVANRQLAAMLTAAASDHLGRARDLSDSLNAVKSAVADQLWSNVDITKIYSAMSSGLQKSLSNVVSQQKIASAASSKVAAMSPQTISILNATQKGLGDQVAILASTQGDPANKAQPLADTYDSCVAKASPKKGSSDTSKPGS